MKKISGDRTQVKVWAIHGGHLIRKISHPPALIHDRIVLSNQVLSCLLSSPLSPFSPSSHIKQIVVPTEEISSVLQVLIPQLILSSLLLSYFLPSSPILSSVLSSFHSHRIDGQIISLETGVVQKEIVGLKPDRRPFRISRLAFHAGIIIAGLSGIFCGFIITIPAFPVTLLSSPDHHHGVTRLLSHPQLISNRWRSADVDRSRLAVMERTGMDQL